SGEAVGFGVAAAAALFAFFGRGKPWLGWTTLGAVIVLAFACLLAIAHDVGRAFGFLASAFEDALDGAPQMSSVSGPLGRGITGASIASMLPVLATPSGVDGALASLAQPKSVKQQAAVAMLPVLATVVAGTMMGMAIGATGAYAHPVTTTRQLDQVRF